MGVAIVLGGYAAYIFSCRGSAMAPLERAMVVSYRLCIVTVALSVTIRPQFAIECLRRSNQRGWVTLGPYLGVFPLEQTRHVGTAKSEHPRLHRKGE